MIELKSSAVAFEALSHEARLAVLCRLIPAGPDGVHAGAIVEALELLPTRLSFHLNQLTAAGLIESCRESRYLSYAVRYAGLGDIVRFLVDGFRRFFSPSAYTAECLASGPDPLDRSPDRVLPGHRLGISRPRHRSEADRRIVCAAPVVRFIPVGACAGQRSEFR